MNQPKTRWGLLSTANINRALIPPIQKSSHHELLAVGSRDQDRAEEYALRWSIPRAYGSYEALLADPDIDVIYISLPNRLHAEWSIKAVQAGKHVLCEKPITISLEQMDAIQSASHQTGKTIEEAFMYRHHPQTLKIQQMMKENVVGELRMVHGVFSFNISREGDVRLDPKLSGGCLWDIGCYPVSYTRSLIGKEPLEVFGWQKTGASGVDEVFVGQMRFPGEVFAQFHCSFRAPFQSIMEIVGSEAILTVPRPFKPGTRENILLARGEAVESIRMPGKELYIGEVEDMGNVAQKNSKPLLSLDESRANLTVLLALLQSAREKKPVLIPPR